MLDKRTEFIVRIDGKPINIELTIKTLSNLSEITNSNPFRFLYKYLDEEDVEVSDGMLTTIIIALTDANIGLDNIGTILDNRDSFKLNIQRLIINETISEIKEIKAEDNEINESKVLTDKDELDNWIDLFNYYYYVCLYQLKMSKEEFYNSTLREIKTLDKLNKDYFKNIIINYYIDVNTAKNNTVSNTKPISNSNALVLNESNKDRVRLRDILNI